MNRRSPKKETDVPMYKAYLCLVVEYALASALMIS